MKHSKRWSAPYHGVTHYGTTSDHRWSTITAYGDVYTLTQWSRGHCFDSLTKETDHASEAEAKASGEAWANSI